MLLWHSSSEHTICLAAYYMFGIIFHSVLWFQDLAGLRMNMLNQNTIKVFKSISGIYQDHYPVSAVTPPVPQASCLQHQTSILRDRITASWFASYFSIVSYV